MGALTRAVRNISRRKMRAFLVVIALGFSMAIMISVPACIVANQEAAQNLSSSFSSTITAMQEQINQTLTLIEVSNSSSSTPGNSSYFPGGQFRPPFGGQEENYLDGNIIENIVSIQNVTDVVPAVEKSEGQTTTVTTRYGGTFTMLRPDYTIVGVPLNSSLITNYPILPTNITEGRNLREGDTGVVLLSPNNTGYFGVGVGDEVNILGHNFDVVGVYEPSGFTQARNLYMNITDAQTLTNLTGEVSRVDVYADSSSNVDAIASEISSWGLSVTDYNTRLTQLQNMQTMYNETETTAESTLSQTQTTATQEIIIAVTATSLIVLFVMLYTVRERTKEIGTLKAIGLSNWNVMSQFILEGTLLSLMAGIVGIAIGSIGAPILSGVLIPFHVNPFGSRGTFRSSFESANPGVPSVAVAAAAPNLQLMLLALGAAVLLGVLGSLYPAWRASRTRPAEAMRYE